MANKAHLPEYSVWEGVIQRCTNPNCAAYARYGAKGITVDPTWRSFDAFYADMGKRPLGLTLERRDNTKGYSKENCKWATYQEQNLNRGIIRRNTSGITGVHPGGKKDAKSTKWRAEARINGRNTVLYKGPDFFEAICARKSWEGNMKAGV